MNERTTAEEVAISIVAAGAEILATRDDLIDTHAALVEAAKAAYLPAGTKLSGADLEEAVRLAQRIIVAIRTYPFFILTLAGEGGPTEVIEGSYVDGYRRGRQASAEAIAAVDMLVTPEEAKALAFVALGDEEPSDQLCDVYGFARSVDGDERRAITA